MDYNNFYTSIGFLSECYTLNGIKELENLPFQQLHSRNTQFTNMFSFKLREGFGIWSLIMGIRIKLLLTSLRSVSTSKMPSEYFPVWISQFVNESMVFSSIGALVIKTVIKIIFNKKLLIVYIYHRKVLCGKGQTIIFIGEGGEGGYLSVKKNC